MNFKRFLAILLAAVMCVSLAACTGGTEQPSQSSESASESASEPVAEDGSTPLVVAEGAFSEKFSPFFADTVYDNEVWYMTAVIQLLTTDRAGAIVYNAIEGETHNYNGTDYLYTGPADVSVVQNDDGTTTYTIKIRDDIKFSDGEVADADDIIFTYYVFLDPAYVGSTTLSSYDIVGLKAYQANNSLAEDVDIAGGLANLANDTELQQAIIDGVITPTLTSELEWTRSLYGNADYASYTEAYPENKDLFAAFYSKDEAYDSTTVADEATVLADIIAQYGYDYEALGSAYAGDKAYFNTDVNAIAQDILLPRLGEGEPVPNISGIKKIDQQTVSVTTNGYEAPAIYSICAIPLAPMHYYGDAAKYDYDNNMFGHDFGDLSIVESKTTTPMGAGPYKFIEYKDKVVYMEANENYYLGAPKVQYLQFKETNDADGIPGVASGVVDVANPSGSLNKVTEIKGYNSNGELDGDVITTSLVDNLGYGYIGINADTVNVGGDSASDASKNLRKAFATVYSVYRDVAIDSYYGDAASVINYPISNTSWAAPQPADAGYKVAYSVDVNGDPIYTSEMTQDDKYAAAIKAALGFFEAAGYTVTDGKLTAAPEGAKLSYEVMIPGDGIGDHPAFGILSSTSEALATIGMELKVNDLTDSSLLWDALDAGTQEMWTAAWQATIDPDMYQTYHSSGIVGRGGSDSNHYHIDDAELDKLIVDARASDDQAYRKATYKSCLDLIVDWACEIPTYQRQNMIIFSSERINVDTVTPDITTFWNWYYDIQLIEMK